MPANLLRPTWGNLDSHELRLLFTERIGGPGQYDDQQANPNQLFLPLAGDSCRVILTFRGRQIEAVEPGNSFDRAQWDAIAHEIETSVLAGPTVIGCEHSFAGHRVEGSWSGSRSGVQIIPAHPDSPRAPFEMAEHPFILEFQLQRAGLWSITNHRRIRQHRELTLVLNVLLRSRMSLLPRRPEHFWGMPLNKNGWTDSIWIQNFYSGTLGKCLLEAHTPAAEPLLEVIRSELYYAQPMGIDGEGLRVPDDLDDSICRYLQLAPTRRAEFDRAAFWFDLASRQWAYSMSASFAALVSAIESLINRGGPGSTRRFRNFLESYAPGATMAEHRNEMYELRSSILHGSDLIAMDQGAAYGWDPPWWNERELHERLWKVTQTAAINWLRSPPPV